MDGRAVADFTKAVQAAKKFPFPPIDVFSDPSDPDTYYLADGWHRVEAAKKADLAKINARVHAGGKAEAVLFACAANVANNCVRRTNADKRRAVMLALQQPGWKNKSLKLIADHCGVDPGLVKDVRADMEPSSDGPKIVETVRNGAPLKINTANIGSKTKKKKAEVAAPAPEAPAVRDAAADREVDAARDPLLAIADLLPKFWAAYEKLTGSALDEFNEMVRKDELRLPADRSLVVEPAATQAAA